MQRRRKPSTPYFVKRLPPFAGGYRTRTPHLSVSLAINLWTQTLIRIVFCKTHAAECLILLLYCQSVAVYPIKSKLKFALAHAVRLVESAEALRDRQIGQCVWIVIMIANWESRSFASISILYPEPVPTPWSSSNACEYTSKGTRRWVQSGNILRLILA